MPAAVISAKATAASAGGVTGSLGLLVLSECGIPMPIPADVLMLLVALVALLAVAVLVRSVVRRRAGVAPVQAWSEAVCPACLAVTAIDRRSSGRSAL